MSLSRIKAEFDLLLVFDAKDLITRFRHRVIEAFTSTKPRLNIGMRNIADLDNEKNVLHSKKVLFMLHASTRSYVELVDGWLQELPGIKGSQDKHLILLNTDSYEEIDWSRLTNVVVIMNLDNLSVWWPKLLRFVYKTEKTIYCKVRMELKKKADQRVCHVQRSYARIKSCLREFGVVFDKSSAIKVFGVTLDFEQDTNIDVFKHEFQRSHVVASDISSLPTLAGDMKMNVYSPRDEQRSVLWILIDLGLINAQRDSTPRLGPCDKFRKACVLILVVSFVIIVPVGAVVSSMLIIFKPWKYI